MNKNLRSSINQVAGVKNRRDFLKYVVGGAITSVTMGYLFPKASHSQKVDLETLCSLYPDNSSCQNYLPGFSARDDKGHIIAADALLANARPGIPVKVKGLPDNSVDYLVIERGPKIAKYAIKPICTHLGCTVKWNPQKNRFICPCHGSQYDHLGRVIHGPARRPLPLITVVVKENQIRLVNQKPAIDPRSPLTTQSS